MSTQLRCPVNPSKMFGKTGIWHHKPGVEVSCQDCRRAAHRSGESNVAFVLHRYDLYGWLFETEVVRVPPI